MDTAGEFNRKLIQSVVGFRIYIGRIEGKFKLSQNHSRERRERLVESLRAATHDDSAAVADLMAETLRDSPR
jgi:transcriptional regulator